MRNENLNVLATVLEAIVAIPASEASSERGFAVLDQLVPKRRACMAAETVSMQIRYKSLLSSGSWTPPRPTRQSIAGLTAEQVNERVAQQLQANSEEEQKVQKAIVTLLRLAGEKLEVMKERKMKKETKKKRKANLASGAKHCEGPVDDNGIKSKCAKGVNSHNFTETKFTFFMKCVVCDTFRCNNCAGAATLTRDEMPARFECKACLTDARDEWWDFELEAAPVSDDEDDLFAGI